jgi:NhaP-type Na+/H+ or K+/H+ antiporter
MEENTRSGANARFRDYTFTKMAPEGDVSVKNCNEANVSTSRPFQHIKRWLSANLLLIVTICGVLFGLIIGEFALRMICKVAQSQMQTKSISRLCLITLSYQLASYFNPLKPDVHLSLCLIIQSVPQRKHHTSPLQRSTG